MNVSMNSEASSCGIGFWFSGFDMSTTTWHILRPVVQNPGSERALVNHVYYKGQRDNTMKHQRTGHADISHISRLFPQFSHRSLFRRFSLVYQSCWNLDTNFSDWGSELLLQHYLPSCLYCQQFPSQSSTSSGPIPPGFINIATTPTASTSVPFGLVVR